MYIGKISLRNIKGFKELDFNLKRPDDSYAGWTVFTGDNGSGKSTLLKAIAVGLVGKDTARALQASYQGWIGHNSKEASIELEIVRVQEDDQLKGYGAPPDSTFPALLVLTNGGKETSLQIKKPEGRQKSYQTPQRTVWSTDAGGWFACGYGPFRRAFGASNDAMQQMLGPLTKRFATMFQEAASLGEAERWLKELNHKSLDNKQQESEILAILLDLLKDELLPNQITVSRVDSDGLWLQDRTGMELAWSDLSDGYRSMLALLCDIIRHMGEAYGWKKLTGRDLEGRLIIVRSGVVLIDEIDAHLHPEWQREIGFWLKRHFPKVQFIVTSHSPLICQAADPNGIFKLTEPGSGEKPYALSEELIQKIRASKADTILLSPAFDLDNTRSPIAVESRAHLAELNAKKRAGVALSANEKELEKQYSLFVNPDEA